MTKGKKRALLFSAIAAVFACASAPALMAVAQQPAPAAQPDTLIHAGHMLADPATGRVLTEQSILVRGGRIISIAAGYTAPTNGTTVVDLKRSFVLPGLIDSHVHITGEQGPTAASMNSSRPARTRPSTVPASR